MKYLEAYTIRKLEYNKYKLLSLLNKNLELFFLNENFNLEVRKELDKEMMEQIRIGLSRL